MHPLFKALLTRPATLAWLGLLVASLASLRPAQATGETGVVVAAGPLSGGALAFEGFPVSW